MSAPQHPTNQLASVPDVAVACTFCGRDASGPLAATINVDGTPHPFCCTDHGELWTLSLRHQLRRYV